MTAAPMPHPTPPGGAAKRSRPMTSVLNDIDAALRDHASTRSAAVALLDADVLDEARALTAAQAAVRRASRSTSRT